MTLLDDFINSLYLVGGITFGNFKTRNNNTHPLYMDLRICMSYPRLMNMLVDLYSKYIEDNITCMCSIPYGSIHLASCLAYKMNKKLIIPRKDGTVCGKLTEQDKIYFVEDIVTTGKSVFDIVRKIDSDNNYPNILCFLSYYKHKHVQTITTLDYILNLLESNNYISADIHYTTLRFFNPITNKQTKVLPVKNSNLIVALDVDTWDEAKKHIINLGEYVTGFKFHFDLIDGIDFKELRDLHVKYNFVVLNDRKYADVPHINQKMSDKIDFPYIFNIVHAISGIDSFPSGPIIIVLEMSNNNTLITPEYRNKVIQQTENIPNLVGYVSQHKWWNSDKLCFTPGIKNEKDITSAKERGADIIIVGRSIINDANPKKRANDLRICSE